MKTKTLSLVLQRLSLACLILITFGIQASTAQKKKAAGDDMGAYTKLSKYPPARFFVLDKPLMNDNSSGDNRYHGDGVHNLAYKPIWLTMLGSGL